MDDDGGHEVHATRASALFGNILEVNVAPSLPCVTDVTRVEIETSPVSLDLTAEEMPYRL